MQLVPKSPKFTLPKHPFHKSQTSIYTPPIFNSRIPTSPRQSHLHVSTQGLISPNPLCPTNHLPSYHAKPRPAASHQPIADPNRVCSPNTCISPVPVPPVNCRDSSMPLGEWKKGLYPRQPHGAPLRFGCGQAYQGFGGDVCRRASCLGSVMGRDGSTGQTWGCIAGFGGRGSSRCNR